jgi:hypothetical protein
VTCEKKAQEGLVHDGNVKGAWRVTLADGKQPVAPH